MKPYLSFILIFGITLAACASYEQYAAERTAQLREMYPPGTSKEVVQAQWGEIKPDFSVSRPSLGWDSHSNRYIAEKLRVMEAGMGKRIESVERYWGPDGWLSLCYCWYFYDSRERIVDVEWQYKSD